MKGGGDSRAHISSTIFLIVTMCFNSDSDDDDGVDDDDIDGVGEQRIKGVEPIGPWVDAIDNKVDDESHVTTYLGCSGLRPLRIESL
ncbi:hypothetical protein KTT_43250 [Tengunoibacter tsumagoiensis]|uniref:Uncharacterized protein n=1 Tax=Tengunoibacter tsumagoiensis TaxID=2014871 RepID=A0A402A607_9CHLR|nr:hypothetical protein KTT_43250 [Tengunoibacter tsumagoiensis]